MYDPALTQDVLGQLPLLKAYNHIMVGFPLHDTSNREEIIQSLESAALKLTAAIPWLGGKVVNVGSGPESSGHFQSVPYLLPPYQEIVAAKGPASMLDGAVIGPKNAFPASYEESETDPAPALLIQASFLTGGLVLDFAAQHNMSDGGGVLAMLNVIATALRGQEIPASTIEAANLDRRTVIPLLGPEEPLLDHSHLIRPPPPAVRRPLPSLLAWCFFRFSSEKLNAIKTEASNPAHLTVPFISRDDALCAFLWKRITSVRLRRRNTPDDLSKFTRAVDIRKTMGIPFDYMGVSVTNATTWLSFQELIDLPLAAVASELRKTLNQIDAEFVRSFTTFVSRQNDKRNIAYAGKFNADTDMGTSSMASVPLYKANFGPLGEPTLVRRPTFAPIPSTIYVMPQTLDGDVDALFCLGEADIAALRDDPEWNSSVEYIG
ncbi:trichothecene 3-O-acetyltransferase, putative [Talaromyces stipitatus ATCC 10500]|uniref:Trichothecene 3-O-acetyltransferase, putative n=1 Tax=Talaromyces stipitatus (strain ATCC 10500 / CBS 375.48 / QM 6759 / NRRL 1006) TaxID=441959 RepID=B8LV28_TALSN|nr:trichothecene 3-O-acetyltransferase, putative [Talaromyces stipitatus ATCC 10500]EED22649.1 trichothecene 3-O-acetyltransferase, putative [Talaromyces stipitatus ATCC 10500]